MSHSAPGMPTHKHTYIHTHSNTLFHPYHCGEVATRTQCPWFDTHSGPGILVRRKSRCEDLRIGLDAIRLVTTILTYLHAT